MYADGVCLQRDVLAGDGGNLLLLDHADDAGDGLVFVGDHRTFLRAVHEGTILLVRAVGEDLRSGTEAAVFGGADHLTAGEGHEDQLRIVLCDGFADAVCELVVLRGHVVERAMRLHMLHLQTGSLAECIQRADLVQRIGLRFRRADRHVAATEAHEVRIARMCADMDAGLPCHLDGLFHHDRIRCMKSTCHVGRGDQRDDLIIRAQGIAAEALAEVAV